MLVWALSFILSLCHKSVLSFYLWELHLKLFWFSFIWNLQLHTFPEGKVSQENEPIRRLKWGTASLIARAPVTPIVLPIVHRGFQEVSFPSISLNVPKKALPFETFLYTWCQVIGVGILVAGNCVLCCYSTFFQFAPRPLFCFSVYKT